MTHPCTLLLLSLWSYLYFPLPSGLQNSTAHVVSGDFGDLLPDRFQDSSPEFGFLSWLLAFRKALVPGSMTLLRVSQFKSLTPTAVECNNDSLNGLVLIWFSLNIWNIHSYRLQ